MPRFKIGTVLSVAFIPQLLILGLLVFGTIKGVQYCNDVGLKNIIHTLWEGSNTE